MASWYIASCVFTSQFPELSLKIQNYIKEHHNISIVRCCVPGYKVTEFEGKMPEGFFRDNWRALPDSGTFAPGDDVYSLCHNCNNIIEEVHPGVHVHSLWELIDRDPQFPFPDYTGVRMTVQDCWRAKDRADEQKAVRKLLQKMNIETVELPANHKVDFCGVSLYRSQPPRNPKLAPRHYVEAAVGKFIPYPEEKQIQFMQDYCERFDTEKVVCYCHYCLEGLLLSHKVDAFHIAQLLFA